MNIDSGIKFHNTSTNSISITVIALFMPATKGFLLISGVQIALVVVTWNDTCIFLHEINNKYILFTHLCWVVLASMLLLATTVITSQYFDQTQLHNYVATIATYIVAIVNNIISVNTHSI